MTGAGEARNILAKVGFSTALLGRIRQMDRVREYLAQARAVEAQARVATDPEHQRQFIEIAAHWRNLARQIAQRTLDQAEGRPAAPDGGGSPRSSAVMGQSDSKARRFPSRIPQWP